jgi:hypothetical protein
MNRIQRSSVLDFRSSRGVDCTTDCCLVVANVGERLAVSKWEMQKIDVKSFYLKKLNEVNDLK